MKKISALLFALSVSLSLPVSAQRDITTYQGFHVVNREVIWARVFHQEEPAEVLSEKLFSHLSRKVWIENLRYDGKDIVGNLINYRPDYKRYGGKFRNTSILLRTGKWDGKVTIHIQDGKYRVILEGLHYEAQQATTGSGKATIEKHPVSGMLSAWALNDYRTSFRKKRFNNLDILHLSFSDSFTLTTDQLIDGDW